MADPCFKRIGLPGDPVFHQFEAGHKTSLPDITHMLLHRQGFQKAGEESDLRPQFRKGTGPSKDS